MARRELEKIMLPDVAAKDGPRNLFDSAYASADAPKPEAIKKRMTEGEEALKKGDYKKAEECAKDAVAYYRANFDKDDTDKQLGPLTLLARSLNAQKKYAVPEYDEALRLAQLKDKKRPTIEIAQLHFERGYNLTSCDAKRQDPKEAQKSFTEGLKQLDNAPQNEKADAPSIVERYWLYSDLHASRAEAIGKRKDASEDEKKQAREDEASAKKYQGHAELWGPRGYMKK